MKNEDRIFLSKSMKLLVMKLTWVDEIIYIRFYLALLVSIWALSYVKKNVFITICTLTEIYVCNIKNNILAALFLYLLSFNIRHSILFYFEHIALVLAIIYILNREEF